MSGGNSGIDFHIFLNCNWVDTRWQ